jgi:hypothetical protein
MNKRNLSHIFLLLLLTAYNFFFWGEKFGVNLPLFLVLCSVAVLFLNGDNVKSKNGILTLLAVLYSGAMLVVVNSVFSKLAVITISIAFVGFVHQRELKTLFNAVMTTLSGFIIFPYNIFEEIRYSAGRYRPVGSVLKIMKLTFIPIIFFVIFYSIYAYSNPVFNTYSVNFWSGITDWLYEVFADYPVLRFFYIFFGLILIMGILYNRNIKAFADIDKTFLDNLLRDSTFKTYSVITPSRKKSILYSMFSYRFKFNSLKLEYKMGLILVFMMNALLLLLNIIDIQFTWFGFDSSRVDNLAYYVHNGTYLLIFSILLSMAILLYLFRRNQNFYSGNRLLKFGAYMWIFQNAVMAFSVALRNLYYIDYYYALSYKRIGVIVYLLLTLVGLVTMFIKIQNKKTTFFLFKANSWALMIVLLLISSFSWDKTIAEFNLSNPNKEKIDVEYLLRLSDDTLPILDKHKSVLNRDYMGYHSFLMDDYENGLDEYNHRVKNFLIEQKNYTWLSFNLPDNSVKQYYQPMYDDNGNRKFDK